MEYINLLQGIIDMVLITIALICIIDYFRISHEVKELKQEAEELVEEFKFKYQLRTDTEKRENGRRYKGIN